VNRIGAFLIGLLLGGAAVGGAFLVADDGDEPVAAPAPRPSVSSPQPTLSSPPEQPSPTPAPTSVPSSPDPLDGSDHLRLDGIGALSVGMTVEEMEEATGMHLRVSSDFSPECRYAQFDGGPDGLYLMLSHRVLVRIDVTLGSAIETDTGIAIDDPIEEAEVAYEGHLEREQHPYLGNRGSYLVYDLDPDDGLLLILESDRHVITSFRSGYDQQVRYIEGCA
jgi:hypothetical protein